MVIVKAAFNKEIRRMTVESDITYLELVQKLISAFPSLRETKENNVHLYYKDSDGDQICFCSNDELKTAVEFLGEDNTLRVLIGEEEEKASSTPHNILLFDSDDIFADAWREPFSHGLASLIHGNHSTHHHHFSPIGGLFREQALREREEHLRQQRLYEEKVRRAELERRKALLEKIKQAREEQIKQLAESRQKSTQNVSRTTPRKHLVHQFPPGWSVAAFGSCEPMMQECPQFTQWTWGPYGYHATYGSKDDAEETEKKEENEEKMDDQQPHEESVPTTATTAAAAAAVAACATQE